MEDSQDYIKDIKEIRSIMERSSRFISLSGWSGILAGIYALAGTLIAYRFLGRQFSITVLENHGHWSFIFIMLLIVLIVILILALFTAVIFSYYRAKRQKLIFWGPGSKQLLTTLSVPLVAGGLFVITMAIMGHFETIVPSFLIFYGISLVQGAKYTLSAIQWMGYAEILLGLISSLLPGYGLLFWAMGFGIMHLIYGIIMLLKFGM